MITGLDICRRATEADNPCSIFFGEKDNRAGRIRAGLTAKQSIRFWSKVQPSDGCWLWTGATFRNGYGMFNAGRWLNGRQDTRYAHRVAYQLTTGSIPAGLVVMHVCDTPACVRASHLSLGTQADNNRDCRQKGRDAREHPGAWTVEPALRRHLIAASVTAPRGTLARLCREHNLSYAMYKALAVAVSRERHRRNRARRAA
jgi:hypothetical protein